MISINDKILYVHYPKTGGTFVRETIKEIAKIQRVERNGFHGGHAPLNGFEHSFEYVFATVRNPIDWYGSAWKFLKQFLKEGKNSFKTEIPLAHIQEYYSNDFNTFVSQVQKDFPGFYSISFQDYIGSYSKVDRYMKCETLSFDLASFCILKGLGKANEIIASPKHGQRIIEYNWNEKLKKQVIKNEWNIIQKFYL